LDAELPHATTEERDIKESADLLGMVSVKIEESEAAEALQSRLENVKELV
jgi:hypothetical protein